LVNAHIEVIIVTAGPKGSDFIVPLHLLQICLVYINTLLIQRVLAEPQHQQAMQPEDWRALTPLIYHHITPYGWFHLNLQERLPIEEVQSA
jgi:hypothetical protein